MKHIIKSLLLGVVLIFTLVSSTVPVLADTANLYLSPASSSVSKGSILTVSIRENSGGEPVNSVQANLSYPANLLDFVSASSSSAWGVVAQNSGGGGSVQIARGALPAVSGDQLVASIRFKAKTDSGTANITFAAGSAVISASSNTDVKSGASGGNYTLKAPAPTAEPTPEPPKDTIPPTITSVTAKEISATTAVISWTTSEPATSEVVYGPSVGYGIAAADAANVTDHKITLSSPLITPGTKYHYMVKSVDPAGNAASSPDKTFSTKGAILVAKVVNQKNKPVAGAKVTFGDISGTTDKKGQATLSDLPLGKQTGTVTFKGKQMPATVNIEKIDPKGKSVTATFKIDVSSDLWLKIIILLLVAALIGLFFYRRRSGGPSASGPTPGGPGNKAVKLLKRLKDLLPKKETKNSTENRSGKPVVVESQSNDDVPSPASGLITPSDPSATPPSSIISPPGGNQLNQNK